MKRVFRGGAYIWSGCAAGWFVIGLVTQTVMPFVLATGLFAMAGLYLILAEVS